MLSVVPGLPGQQEHGEKAAANAPTETRVSHRIADQYAAWFCDLLALYVGGLAVEEDTSGASGNRPEGRPPRLRITLPESRRS